MRSQSPGSTSSAGSPPANQPIGTAIPGGMTLLTPTTAWNSTSAPSPRRAPLKTTAPVAMRVSPSITHPVRWACGPTSTLSPSLAGCSGTPRMTAFSITTQLAPISTEPPSAVSTAPNSTRLCGPTLTSPQSTAVGAM